MDITAIINTLRALQESDTPTTAGAVKKLVEPLTDNTLDVLREWVDGLNEMVSDLEDAVTTLASAEREDREDAHATLTGDAAALLDELSTLL